MAEKSTIYRIDRADMECCCDWCGAPLMIGDYAYDENGEGMVFCSPKCCSRELLSRLLDQERGSDGS